MLVRRNVSGKWQKAKTRRSIVGRLKAGWTDRDVASSYSLNKNCERKSAVDAKKASSVDLRPSADSFSWVLLSINLPLPQN